MSPEETRTFVGELYQSHNKRLLRFLGSRIRNARFHASDLAQEVYLRLSRISKPRTIREPQAYLFRVARSVIFDHQLGLAASQSLDLDSTESGDEAAVAPDPATQLEQRQRLERINGLLEGLPPRARAIFLLHRAYGHTLDEMSERFEVSRSQIKKDFAKAVAYLNQHLREGE